MSELAGKGPIFLFGSISKRPRVKPEGRGMHTEPRDAYGAPSDGHEALPKV